MTHSPDDDHSVQRPIDKRVDRPVGVLLTNLGTPDAPTPGALRRYLGEFLWDERVIDAPRWLWWLVLHGVILRIRPRRSAALYQKVWTEEGSPLLAISRRQREALEHDLAPHFPMGVHVTLGMRYGNPSIASAIDELLAANCQRILIFPAYPQYAAATTASTFDAVGAAFAKIRVVPELRFINGYHLDPGYVEALAQSYRAFNAGLRDAAPASDPGTATKTLFSFHGIPKRYVELGDPYQAQCDETARALAKTLNLADDQWAIAFQSRVGREEWLRPYTDELLTEWGQSGISSVQVLCPGFSVDCLETIDEIAREARDTFVEAGGSRLDYIPALNDAATHISALANIVLERTHDWWTPPRTAPSSD